MADTELWQFMSANVDGIESSAEQAEKDGWDGLLVTDSQNLSPDPYIALTLAAKATERLMLGTGVTNPITRHAAVTANAMATLQEVSRGRMSLGIGRGDSALFNIGEKPAAVSIFEVYVERVRRYLRGEVNCLNGWDSELRWIAQSKLPPVPVDVAGTGPKVLTVGARHADRVSFALGTDPERLAWGIEHVRRHKSGDRMPSLGAYINVCVTDDRVQGVELIRSGVATFAHFSGMKGGDAQAVSNEDKRVFEQIDRSYDRKNHGRSQSTHAQSLPEEFLGRFAVVGDPEFCVSKLKAIAALGIQRLIIIGPNLAEFPAEAKFARARFVEAVIPNFKHA